MTEASPGGGEERVIRASETAEADWRCWLADGRLPPLEPVSADTRLVVVAPHPDDEIIGCGGLICRHVAAGGRLTIVAVTDGEASHPGDHHWPPAALVAERRCESTRGLVELGAADVDRVRLGLPDGAVATCSDDLVDALRRLVRPVDVLLATWRHDGHPDHEATGAAAARVALDRGCRLLEMPVWMWHGCAPDDVRIPWPRLRTLTLQPHERAAKRRAIDRHATQSARQRGGAGSPVLDTAILARVERPFECYFV